MKNLKGKTRASKNSKYNAAKVQGFSSNLEVMCNAILKESGLDFDYEPRSYELAKSFNFCFYDGVKGEMKYKCIARNMGYTPDFVCPNESWFLETKGMSTPDFQMRFKLFRAWCLKNKPNALLLICHNRKEIEAAITLIKKHLENEKLRAQT